MNEKNDFKISELKTVATIVTLAISVLGNIAEIIVGIIYIISIKRIQKGDILSDSEIFFSEGLFGFLQIGNVLVTLLCAIPFCLWIYQAYKNLFSFGVMGLQYSPAWAVGSFFVPILNFFRPGKVVREIFNASDTTIDNPNNRDWIGIKDPKLVSAWWTSFILAACLNQLNNLLFKKPTLDNINYSTVLFIVSDISLISAAIFAILMILEINKKQEEKYILVRSANCSFCFGDISEIPSQSPEKNTN
jgi:phosphotransferase system  glucose/maltose/N-acetylglucosamine-specific IIC component